MLSAPRDHDRARHPRAAGQFADQVGWQGEPFDVTAVDGSGLSEALGAQVTSTACYRGYVASYRVDDDQLVLARTRDRLLP